MLTAEQRRAVASKAHALEIRAGAGTGKTTTLAHRLARIVADGSPEHRLLAVTFTRDATVALSRKLGALLGKGHGIRVSSFHQWAARELAAEEPRYLGQDDARRIVLRSLQTRPASAAFSSALGGGDDVAARVLGFLSYVKNAQTSVGGAVERQFPALAPWIGDLEELWDRYHHAKGDRLDYDDLLLLFRERVGGSATFRAEVAARLDHLAVDEYQDVNGPQVDIVRALTTGKGAPDVTVVGDARQSIYGFRGGGPAHLDAFLEPYGRRGARVPLTVCWRSTRAIVHVGNALLPDAHPLRARPRAPAGNPPIVAGYDDGLAEAKGATARLRELLDAGAQPQDCVVLVRARPLASRFVDEARAAGIEEVPLRTIHAAKGLEWDHVVVLGAREGGLPSSHVLRASPAAQPALLEEEKRLLYVAATRARKTLMITYAGTPSRFLAPLREAPAAREARSRGVSARIRI